MGWKRLSAGSSMFIRRGCLISIMILIPVIAVAGNSPDYWFRILVPDNLVPAQIGRAVFREGKDEILVLAARLPVRQYALQQLTGLTEASVRHLPNATVLRIPVPSGQLLIATPGQASFHVRIGKTDLSKAIGLTFDTGEIHFSSKTAGPVIAITDSQTGRPLLIGTVTGDVAISQPLSGPGYRLLPASRGIAVVASSDELLLSSKPAGFVLKAKPSGGGLPVGNPPITPPLTAASYMPDGLNLPRGGLIQLRKRLQAARLAVAEAPALDRQDVTFRLARVMLALGMGIEARGALEDLARAEPSAEHDPKWSVLLAVADTMAWNPEAAAGLWPHWRENVPERRLWHGLADIEEGKFTQGASQIAKQISLLAALPPVARSLLVPRAAEALIADGKTRAAHSLFRLLPHDPDLALARAELQQSEGHDQLALGSYQALIGSRNDRVAGIARTRAIMLRYQLHQVDARTAARELSRHIYEWRGDRHELATRLDIARLQAADGAWPEAMTGLNHARALFPDQETKINVLRHTLFGKLTRSGALDKMTPLAVTALIENNTDLVPPGAAGVPILKTLSRQLLALGLVNPAADILRHLIDHTTDPDSLAHLGLDLARLEMRAGDLKEAARALEKTNPPGIAPDLLGARSALGNEIALQDGRPTATHAIADEKDPNDLAKLARLASARGDRKTEIEALQRLVSLRIPKQGMLDVSQEQLLTQLATAATKTGDPKLVAHLRQFYLHRFPIGPQAGLFDTITASPLGSNSSLAEALHQITAIETLADDKTGTSPPK